MGTYIFFSLYSFQKGLAFGMGQVGEPTKHGRIRGRWKLGLRKKNAFSGWQFCRFALHSAGLPPPSAQIYLSVN